MKKSKLLRELMQKEQMVRIVGAHNGMSAKLAEEAGFEGIWASGLEVSTAHAVPDANILTMSDYLRAASYMNDAVKIPVVVDADTGYGNSNNVIYMVKKFEAAGIAAVCMEDKLFPKVNSFVPGRQELAPIAEFVGKIMAAKNAQQSNDFVVFARVEALIAGWGQEEALKRAYAYQEAGADGIFIHSKSKTMEEIQSFIDKWSGHIPLVVCPTTYPSFNVAQAQKTGKVKVYIFANHGIRSAVKAMQETFANLYSSGDINTVQDKIASMKTVFEIQGMPQMKEDEKKYLRSGDKIQVVIPAAGVVAEDSLFGDMLKDLPVAMLDVNGKSILQRNVNMLNLLGLQDINVIIGHEGEKIDVEGVYLIKNKEYQKTGIVHSIMCAHDRLTEKTLVLFSDITFEKNILERLLKREEDIVLVIDCAMRQDAPGRTKDLVKAEHKPPAGDRIVGLERNNPILTIGASLTDATHEFIGIALFSKKGMNSFKEIYTELEKSSQGEFHQADSFSRADLTDMIQEMISRGHTVSAMEINKGWTEIHNFNISHAFL